MKLLAHVIFIFNNKKFVSNSCFLLCRLLSISDANLKLKLGSGILIAVPIPKEHSASGNLIESAIQTALREARWNHLFLIKHNYISIYSFFIYVTMDLILLDLQLLFDREKNITGNAETPFLLARVNELTRGVSLSSSILFLLYWRISVFVYILCM